VEHLLRDVKDSTISTLAAEVGRMVTGLKGLKARLLEVEQYLHLVLAGKLPVNHDIMYQLQVGQQTCSLGSSVTAAMACTITPVVAAHARGRQLSGYCVLPSLHACYSILR
jgi:hypothetical protein